MNNIPNMFPAKEQKVPNSIPDGVHFYTPLNISTHFLDRLVSTSNEARMSNRATLEGYDITDVVKVISFFS